MNPRPSTLGRQSLGDDEYGHSPRWLALSFVLAILFSGALLFGLSQAQKTTRELAPVPPEDLRAVVSSPLPPPPPPQQSTTTEATESRPSPIEVATDLVEVSIPDAVRVVKAPTVAIVEPKFDVKLELQTGDFKPQGGRGSSGLEARRIYERTEVDQPVIPVNKIAPYVHNDLLKKTKARRVLLLFVVGTDGLPADIHVLESITPEVDATVIEAVRQWTFRPAKKNKRTVPQWVQLPVVLNQGSRDPLKF